MKRLSFVLRAALAIIYRLVMLALTERWIPLSRGPFALTQSRGVPPQRGRANGASDPSLDPSERVEMSHVEGKVVVQAVPVRRVLLPAIAAQSARAGATSRPLARLLRDPHAVRDALLLDAALGTRRRRR